MEHILANRIFNLKNYIFREKLFFLKCRAFKDKPMELRNLVLLLYLHIKKY
jgi:hypothetical protein